MTPEQWREFGIELQARWPSLASWVHNRADPINHRKDTYRLWYREVFAWLELADCLNVVRAIYRGELEKWERFEDLPATISRNVSRLVERRERAKRHDKERGHYVAVRRLQRLKAPVEQIEAAIDKLHQVERN